MHEPERLLVVAHGTAAPEGTATTERLVADIAAARPGVPVEYCYLDVAEPSLPRALATLSGPTVLVPLLLSTGYHVQTDIPRAVGGRPDVRIARHLGPHPLLVDALVDRLREEDGAPAAATVLVGTGSSRPDAAAELRATADLLGTRLGRPVPVLTMADDLKARLGELDRPAEVATYLLAPGRFVDVLRAAATGIARVAAPIGLHPALVRLVWQRYDEAVAGERGAGVR
ncbi:MAG TPA: sirohydrochlorin chelatase [Jatrophihabitans sp.]|nr:sirohydrochlorin chelatase [Jatrophihabitans sp.]